MLNPGHQQAELLKRKQEKCRVTNAFEFCMLTEILKLYIHPSTEFSVRKININARLEISRDIIQE